MGLRVGKLFVRGKFEAWVMAYFVKCEYIYTAFSLYYDFCIYLKIAIFLAPITPLIPSD